MRRSSQKNNIRKKIAVYLALVLCISLFCPGTVSAMGSGGDVIHIRTQEDLRELAKNCRLDTWSQGKTVILDQDLTLDETADFLPIPTFGGTLEGNGHRISGFTLTGEDAQTGLFDTIQAGGVVTDLTVVGQVTPSGDSETVGGIAGRNYGKIVNCTFEGAVKAKTSVGGIVGINETTGQIIQCRFQGVVTGEHYVGGIAGQNTGSMIQCENSGDINTTVVEVSADLTDLPELSELRTTESLPAGTDIGGIAGFSSGMIQGCKNTGNVGYEHMGYNVGGIVGRQSGHLDGCSNTGMVQGRKDIGGIAGQLEPQVILRYGEDTLQRLWTELDVLQGLIDQTLTDTESVSNQFSGDIDRLISDIGTAKDATSDLSGAIKDWGNENIGEINDAAARLSWVISQSEPILEDVSDAVESLEDASDALSDAVENAADAGEQGGAAVSELQDASQELQNGITHIKNSRTHLRTALKEAADLLGGHTGTTTEQILEELQAAKEDLQNAILSPKKAIDHANQAGKYLEGVGEPGSDALEDMTDASDELDTSLSQLERALEQLSDVATTLADEPEISFSPIDSSVTDRGDDLDAALSQMLDGIDSFRDGVSSSSDTLQEDIRVIGDQLGVIVDVLQESVEETQEEETEDRFEDISDEDTGESEAGRITASKNEGSVYGDVNVAGIVGSMSIEYDFDPEDDLTEEGTRSLDFRYKTLAVVTDCVNQGEITSKKDYAGGIVGRMDLGAVKDCGSYGDVSSTDGDHVGGIGGLSRATIRDCFVKCNLSGGDYVGGVTGAGEEESVTTGCYAMVEIPESGRYSGAISGTETGEYAGNYYISEDLAGLGRISYTGKAEPISFEALTQIEGLPEEMMQFTLRFMVEGEEIKSETFTYGDSFTEDVFPEIPEKEGYYAVWDKDDLTELCFDTTVNAEYVRYVLALASEVTRESGRPVFLADGDFDDGAALKVSSIKQTEKINGRTPMEQWYLEFSDKTQDSYTVRYLSPEEDPDGLTVFVKEDGQWKEVESSAFGSYLVFSMASPEGEVAVMTSTGTWLVRLALILLILACLALLVFVMKKRRKRVQETARSAAGTEADTHLPTAAQYIMKLKKWLFPIILGVLLVVVGIWVIGKARAAAGVYDMLRGFAQEQEYAMTLNIDTKLNETMTEEEIQIVKTSVEDQTVICVQKDGISLYYIGDAVLMENGKAYQTSDNYPDESLLPLETAEVFRNYAFSTDREGEETVYQLTAEGEDAKKLLKFLLPQQAEDLTDTYKLSLDVTASEGELVSVKFTSEGTLTDEQKTAYGIQAELVPTAMEKEIQIPEQVKDAIREGNLNGQTEISEDLFRLFSTWAKLEEGDAVSAEISLKTDTGTEELHTQWRYEQTVEEGQKIGCIRKDDTVLYFSDGVFCDGNGVMKDGEEPTAAGSELLHLFYELWMEGEAECMDTGNGTWMYTLSLDQEDMEKIADVIAFESEGEDAVSGNAQAVVKDGNITRINCQCIAEAEDGPKERFSIEMTFSEKEEQEVPAAVKEALLGKE